MYIPGHGCNSLRFHCFTLQLEILKRIDRAMTQKTFRYTKPLLMVLSVALPVALIIYLEVIS